MTIHTSAATREHTPHVKRTTRTATIIDVLKRRAQEILSDQSLDSESRSILRYALETNDPWLARLVRQAEVGESIVDRFASPQTDETKISKDETRASNLQASYEDKIATLTEMICGGQEESPAALLVLMGMLETSAQPKVIANTVKHHAFARCGELNLFGIVDAQIAVLESELFTR